MLEITIKIPLTAFLDDGPQTPRDFQLVVDEFVKCTVGQQTEYRISRRILVTRPEFSKLWHSLLKKKKCAMKNHGRGTRGAIARTVERLQEILEREERTIRRYRSEMRDDPPLVVIPVTKIFTS